jgi:hypothetical protein
MSSVNKKAAVYVRVSGESDNPYNNIALKRLNIFVIGYSGVYKRKSSRGSIPVTGETFMGIAWIKRVGSVKYMSRKRK